VGIPSPLRVSYTFFERRHHTPGTPKPRVLNKNPMWQPRLRKRQSQWRVEYAGATANQFSEMKTPSSVGITVAVVLLLLALLILLLALLISPPCCWHNCAMQHSNTGT